MTQSFPLRHLWWAAFVLLGISVTAVGWTIWQLRTDAIRAAISESGNIATVLAGQLSRSVQGIDSVLLEVKRATKDLDIDTPHGFRASFNRRAFRDMLIDHLSRLPQAFNIAVADAQGRVTVSTAAWPTPQINVADRDYFKDARARADRQLSTSIPIFNRINGKRTIVFARRLESAAGEFVGIIYCSVDTGQFESIYGSIQSVHSHQFTLRKRDGTILARHPDPNDVAGQSAGAGPEWREAVASGAGGYSATDVDDSVSFVSVRAVPEYPLVVDISVTESTALAGWRQRAATIGIGSAALLMCSIYLLVAVSRQVRCLSDSEASLTRKSEQLDAALNNMSQGLTMFDEHHRLTVCNRQYAELYHLMPEQTKPGTPFEAILEARIASGNVPEDIDAFVAGRLEQASRPAPDASCTINMLRDGRIIAVTHQGMNGGGWVAVHQDITLQKRAEVELAHMARYDGLTGLANRTLFMNQANAALGTREQGEEFAILMLDLDRFKTVNDSLGHAVGDSLLRLVALRLRELIPDIDMVARLGGDEFAVLVSLKSGERAPATDLASNILAAITEPYDLDGRRFTIETSIGITFAPQDGTDADSLLKNADLALYRAKSQGGNRYHLFEPSMEAHARERRQLEEDMRRAITRNEFELYYQTIIDAGRRECCGAEALVRWRHPERGFIAPDQFIGLAEESGLIVPLGEWILRKACADAARWPAHLKLAVNLSPTQFRQGDLLRVLKSALDHADLRSERLELEITETVLLEKNEESLAVLHNLKDLGVSIVLDDFGIGYSSMRYLQMFPFDKIKIDKSFIQSMTSHADSAAIVCAIAGLGRALDIETTAEGVETIEQYTFLRSAGCQLAQGYLFSRPVPIFDLTFERPAALRDAAA